MPISNRKLVDGAALFKRDAARELDNAIKALIDLVWARTTPTADFLFESDPELDAEANALLTDLSDALAARAKAIAAAMVRDAITTSDFDADWNEANDRDGTTLLYRFDMSCSHLKELLEIWIALAAVNHIGRSELRVLISRHMSNPFLSPFWKGIRPDALKWGRGYNRDIMAQLALLGQNAIIMSVRRAEWKDEKAKGAEYYIRRRGSWYDCDVCDGLANKPIPIEVPFEVPHSRCCCFPEYFYPEKV